MMAYGNALCQLAPFQDDAAIVTPNFQNDVIRGKRISQITIHSLCKPDGAAINDDGIIQQYFFDTAGKISESLYTVKISYNNWDTIKCKYYYDANNNISIKRTQMGDFYDTWYYKWSKESLLKKEAHIHETGAMGDDGGFKIATQRVISADSFAYASYPKQLQQYGYNEDNKVFQKTITQYDENKRILSRNYHYAVGWLYSQVDIGYDASGRIISYTNTGNLNGDINQCTTIKYDSFGKIIEQGILVDGKQRHHIEYMYDNQTGLISNKLDRDSDKALINIIRFSYEMYGSNGYSTSTK
jgi:YD repeat-containing protein